MGGMTRRWVLRLVLAVLVATGAAAAIGAWYVDRYLDTPLPLAEEALFEIRPGRGLGGIARELETEGLLTHPRLFTLYGRYTDQAARVQAGEYRIAVGETPRGLLARFVSGKVYTRSVTIVEGWTFAEALAQLQAQPALRVETPGMTAEALRAAVWPKDEPLPGDRLEGWLFPDTYHYTRNDSDLALLRRGVERMRNELAAAWSERAPDLPLETPYEALVLASIIEKETALDEERAQVAGVMVRRLERGMRLQTDPTVIYGLGESFDGNIRRADLTRDTPYNTYTRRGLPPTPIALPGLASLRAAVAPADGDTLYFVATGEPDGSHYFSATLEEHNAAVRRYLERRRRADGEGP
jgi:UPF0755 protein